MTLDGTQPQHRTQRTLAENAHSCAVLHSYETSRTYSASRTYPVNLDDRTAAARRGEDACACR
jgi:hypothetical protein